MKKTVNNTKQIQDKKNTNIAKKPTIKNNKREAIANKIADLTMKKAPKKEIKKAIQKSIKIIDAEKKAAAKKPVKPIAKQPVRDKKVYFRIAEKELKKIDSAAKKAKMTRSEYMRSKVLG